MTFDPLINKNFEFYEERKYFFFNPLVKNSFNFNYSNEDGIKKINFIRSDFNFYILKIKKYLVIIFYLKENYLEIFEELLVECESAICIDEIKGWGNFLVKESEYFESKFKTNFFNNEQCFYLSYLDLINRCENIDYFYKKIDYWSNYLNVYLNSIFLFKDSKCRIVNGKFKKKYELKKKIDRLMEKKNEKNKNFKVCAVNGVKRKISDDVCYIDLKKFSKKRKIFFKEEAAKTISINNNVINNSFNVYYQYQYEKNIFFNSFFINLEKIFFFTAFFFIFFLSLFFSLKNILFFSFSKKRKYFLKKNY